jgi:hypothetical protein
VEKLSLIAPAFVEMAHRIVWCSAASVDANARPRSRILHPIWEWDGKRLRGWIGTEATPTKRAHLAASPYLSLDYWDPSHDTCVAECRATWGFDTQVRARVWNLFKGAPAPVGYDPGIIEGWEAPTSASFAVLCLDPWRLRVAPAAAMLGKGGSVLTWREAADAQP